VVLSLVALVVAGFMMWGAVAIISDGNGTGQLSGRQRFGPLDLSRVAAEIADRGPIFFPDASPARRRDIFVQHLGETSEVGWLAFSAFAPGQTDRGCALIWRRPSQLFEDPCSGETFPPDGAGLEQYDVEIDTDAGDLYVDLEGAGAG
jgi:hypothetical protein